MAHNRDYRDPYRLAHGDGPYVCVYCDEALETLETLHHKDHDRTNNALENLEPMHTTCHNRLHHVGLKHTPEVKAQISASMREAFASGRRKPIDVSGERNPFFGRKHSDETKRKISAARRRRRSAAT